MIGNVLIAAKKSRARAKGTSVNSRPRTGSAIRAATSTCAGGDLLDLGLLGLLLGVLLLLFRFFHGVLGGRLLLDGDRDGSGFACRLCLGGGGSADDASGLRSGGGCRRHAAAAAGDSGGTTPTDCGPGEGKSSARAFGSAAAVAGFSVSTSAGSGSGRSVHQHSPTIITSVVAAAAPQTSHRRENTRRTTTSVGSRARVAGSAATRSSGGGPCASDSATGGGGGVHPGGGTMWTMLWHFGHSRICPMAASERTASRAWHVVQEMEKIAFSTVPSAKGMPYPGRSRIRRPVWLALLSWPACYCTIKAGVCHAGNGAEQNGVWRLVVGMNFGIVVAASVACGSRLNRHPAQVLGLNSGSCPRITVPTGPNATSFAIYLTRNSYLPDSTSNTAAPASMRRNFTPGAFAAGLPLSVTARRSGRERGPRPWCWPAR